MQIYPHYWLEGTEECGGDAVNGACILEKTHGPECISYIHTSLWLRLNLLQISRTRVPEVPCRSTFSIPASYQVLFMSIIQHWCHKKSSCCYLSAAMLLLHLMWKVRCLWEEILIPSIFLTQKCKTWCTLYNRKHSPNKPLNPLESFFTISLLMFYYKGHTIA